ncbi:MAG: glycosyltransferase family 39 protein [Nitrospinae bacterium]|nr:glycosyltransferase family 39 protein [Nitrospinota bacterium]
MSLPKPLFKSCKTSYIFAPLILLCVAILLSAGGMRGKTSTADESHYLLYGWNIVTKGSYERFHNSVMPFSALNALALHLYAGDKVNLWTDGQGTVFREVKGITMDAAYFAARLPTLLFTSLLGIFLFRWALELYGFPSALLSLFLFSLCPNIMAHSGLVSPDIPLTCFMFISSYYFWKSLLNPSAGKAVLAGTSMGIAFACKMTAVHMVFIFPLMLCYFFYARKGEFRASWPASLKRLGAIFAISLIVVNSLYSFDRTFTPLNQYNFKTERFQKIASSFLGRIPVPLPYPYPQGIDWLSRDNEVPYPSFLHGEHRAGGWWYYYLYAFAIKEPVPVLILLAIALSSLFKKRLDHWKLEGLIFIAPVYTVIFFSFFVGYHIGLRYVLPAFPFLFLFIGRIMALEFMGQRKIRAALLFPLLCWHAAANIFIYPHYLSYFNELIGGPRNGYKYLIDSNLDWGQNRGLVEKYFEKAAPPAYIHPDKPVFGTIIVSTNSLQGWMHVSTEKYRWLRENFEPVDHIGYTHLVYKITPGELDRLGLGVELDRKEEEDGKAAGSRQRIQEMQDRIEKLKKGRENRNP